MKKTLKLLVLSLGLLWLYSTVQAEPADLPRAWHKVDYGTPTHDGYAKADQVPTAHSDCVAYKRLNLFRTRQTLDRWQPVPITVELPTQQTPSLCMIGYDYKDDPHIA